jgi:hypothetical protein
VIHAFVLAVVPLIWSPAPLQLRPSSLIAAADFARRTVLPGGLVVASPW